MRYRALGRTGLTVSEIGFGCASWWGQKAFPEREAIALVEAAVEGGVTFFDTGAAYSGGNAEPRLGRALKGVDASRLVIATKAGTLSFISTTTFFGTPAEITLSELTLEAFYPSDARTGEILRQMAGL